jgi:alanine racemase
MIEYPEPTLRLRVDRESLADNWRALNALSGDAAAGAAVKADCYGLGVRACVPTLRDAGCASFFVAHWSEVEALFAHVPPSQVAVLHGPVRSDDVAYAKATGVRPVINSLTQARTWIEEGGGTCHLMVDTGINRLGLSIDELGDPLIGLLDVDILMSHLASADEDSATNTLQLKTFCDCLPLVSHRRSSLANSAGVALGSEYAFDLTRPGLSLYGGVQRPELNGSIKQVAYPEAAIIQTRSLKPGDRVGYNGEFEAGRSIQAGTVSLGYADGFLRACGPGNALIHNGAKLPILGKVSMDMVVVDLTDAPELREGDWLQIPFNLPDAAQQSSVSQYELLTVLGSRWLRE